MRDFLVHKAISFALIFVLVGCGFSLQIYGVGGTISGLGTSTGLVLINDSEIIKVAPSTTSFSFLGRLAEGNSYNVTISTQPSDKVCSVKNGKGTISTTSVTDISVLCSPPVPPTVSTFVEGLSYAWGVAIDRNDNLYVTEVNKNLVLKVSPGGVVTTFAGNGKPGLINGSASAASFSDPRGIAIDSAGNVYVADPYDKVIRKITSAGVVSTFAGTGVEGYLDGPALQAKFTYPYGLAIDASDNLYVSEAGGASSFSGIRKISPAGQVTTFAGSTLQGFKDGIGALAKFSGPLFIAADALGNLYVGDAGNNAIRKISTAGAVSTLAGSGLALFNNGIGTAASFSNPWGVAVDSSQTVFVSDAFNSVIRKISSSGQVTTFAGNRVAGHLDGLATSANFNLPSGIAVNSAGVVYVVEQSYIRKIVP